MIVKDSIECTFCGRAIHWYYIIPVNLYSNERMVEVIPNDSIALYEKPYKIGDKKYRMVCYCECGHKVFFDYESDVNL